MAGIFPNPNAGKISYCSGPWAGVWTNALVLVTLLSEAVLVTLLSQASEMEILQSLFTERLEWTLEQKDQHVSDGGQGGGVGSTGGKGMGVFHDWSYSYCGRLGDVLLKMGRKVTKVTIARGLEAIKERGRRRGGETGEAGLHCRLPETGQRYILQGGWWWRAIPPLQRQGGEIVLGISHQKIIPRKAE